MKISMLVASLFFVSSAMANGNVPDTKPDGKNVLPAVGTPCTNKKALKLVLNTFRHLTMAPFIKEHETYNDKHSKKLLNQVGGWMQASHYVIFPKLYHKVASSKDVSVCSGRVFVNGQKVVVKSEEKRTMIRYVVKGDTAFVIDYNVGEIGPWTFKDPEKPVVH
jgi:hypothetical protein